MISQVDKDKIRTAIKRSLPNIEPEEINETTIPFSYIPASHAKAIDPETILVEGIRGSGKSFWWNALNNKKFRNFIANSFPETNFSDNIIIGQGFGEQSQRGPFPDKDTIISYVLNKNECSARNLWQAVIANNLKIQSSFPIDKNWLEKAKWINDHQEVFSDILYDIEEKSRKNKIINLILFDALDLIAQDWESLRLIVKDLFQLALDMRKFKSIRIKLFVRPDMIEDDNFFNFPDASKLKAGKVQLLWKPVDLYALFFVCLANDRDYGEIFRNIVCNIYHAEWKRESIANAWLLDENLRSDEDLQKKIFHLITGPTMAGGASGHKRGFPYTWLPNHLADGRNQVSPRSFMAALRKAAETIPPEEWDYPLHHLGLKNGVTDASQIRVNEIKEDYPWISNVMTPLKGLTIPCDKNEFIDRWVVNKTIKTLINKNTDKLPPQHLNENEIGLLKDLEEIHFIETQYDTRIQMPDVYRIAFGLGRRGGVKPIKLV